MIAIAFALIICSGVISTALLIRSARQERSKHTVFHVPTEDGNTHEVAAHSWVDWVALRSMERRGLPSQEDMRFMLRHMDDPSTDRAIYELLHNAFPRIRRAAQRGGIDLNEN